MFFSKHTEGFLINYEKLGINVNDIEIKWNIPPKSEVGCYQYMPQYIATVSFKYRDMDFKIHFKSIEFPFITEEDIRSTLSESLCHYKVINDCNFICNVKTSTYSSFNITKCYDTMVIIGIVYAGVKGARTYSVNL